MITILYEKISNKSMLDEIFTEKFCEELEKMYNHYLDKHEDTMKSTEISYKDIFGDLLEKDGITNDQKSN